VIDFLTPEQFLASLIVNGVGLSIAFLMRSAPPRIVLVVCLFSMLAILVPWTSLVSSDVASYTRFDTLRIGDQGISAFVASFDAGSDPQRPTLVALLLSVGIIWTITTVVRFIRTRQRWRSESSCGTSLEKYASAEFANTLRRVRIRRLPDSSSVFSTGLLQSEIWIGSEIRKGAQLETALNHELCHIASNDQFTLFAIVVVERLLWWNPLVWLLGQQARRQMEYACDSRCQSLIGNTTYRKSLAELFLNHEPRVTALEVPLGSGSGIINRMERIGMTYSLKKKHILTLLAGSTLIAAASTNLAAQDIEERPSLVQCHKLLPDNVQYDLNITSDIDTREENRTAIRMTLVDATKPGKDDDIPKEAGEFLKCLQKVIGVGDDEGWPEV